jgi:hypothetical protein
MTNKSLKSIKACLVAYNEKIFNLREYHFNRPINANAVYFEILNLLDKDYPGRGVDVFDVEIRDRPMAYGILLSAESNRYRCTGDIKALNFMRKCGNWLLENADLNNNGIYGYGLADPWDAFSDGYINPAHHEYTITTALAVSGLIDWYQLEPDEKNKALIYHIVENCLRPYFDDAWDSPLGIPSYSLNENDKKYDVYNSAAMLAGQLQRFSQITAEEDIRNLSSRKADKIIRIFLENVLADKSGNYYWNHSVQKEKPNDLVHASYIIEGIRDYLTHNGGVKTNFQKISDHIQMFKSGRVWYEHIDKSYHNQKKNARLWALGMLIYTLARDKKFDLIEKTLLKQLASYRKRDGRFKLKLNDERTLIRHEAHLLLGLSYYLFRED